MRAPSCKGLELGTANSEALSGAHANSAIQVSGVRLRMRSGSPPAAGAR